MFYLIKSIQRLNKNRLQPVQMCGKFIQNIIELILGGPAIFVLSWAIIKAVAVVPQSMGMDEVSV